jgi:hypothetical protein
MVRRQYLTLPEIAFLSLAVFGVMGIVAAGVHVLFWMAH